VARAEDVLLQETTGANTTTYVYSATGMLYWVDGSGEPTYRMTDALGSTTRLLDAATNVTDTYTRDGFGAVRSHTGRAAPTSRFTGEHVATAIEPVPSNP